jgi:hypothetical protein
LEHINWHVTQQIILDFRPIRTPSLHFSIGSCIVPHQWLMVSSGIKGMKPLPAVATVVAETSQVTAEVWPRLGGTTVTHWVLKVWVYLNLQQKAVYSVILFSLFVIYDITASQGSTVFHFYMFLVWPGLVWTSGSIELEAYSTPLVLCMNYVYWIPVKPV